MINREICWSCQREHWICDLKHFWVPIGEGLAIGLVYGAAIGAFLSLIVHIIQWASN